MSRQWTKLLVTVLVVLFEWGIAGADYVHKRFSIDQIDSIFLSSISTSADYIAELGETPAPTRIKNAQNLIYHKDYVYIGAENWLLKINSKSFKIEQSVRYGPLYDSPFCRYNPIDECLYGHTKILTNNNNKLLLVYAAKNLLLSCWSARQGICDLRDLDDLSRVVHSSSIAAVANDPLNSTVGFIASSPNSQDVLYMAATYNNNGPYRADIPALSGRSLHSNPKFMQVISSNTQGLKSSKASIEFMSRFMKTFIVKYVDAFNLGIYNYFLTVQHSDTESLQRGDLLASKLARLCLNDLSFTKSYTEIPIRCVGASSANSLRPLDYNELVSSKHIQIGSKHYLVGLFQHTKRTSFNSSVDLTYSKQAVCMFDMDDVQRTFRHNINKCYTSEVMRGLNFIKPNQKCMAKKLRYSPSEHIDEDFCSSAENGLYPIGGTIAAQAEALAQFEDKFYDSMSLLQTSVVNTLVLKSEKRDTLSFYDIGKARLYRSVDLKTATGTTNTDNPLPKVKDIALNANDLSAYVLNGNDLVKIGMFDCERYASCGECIGESARTEPYCGWCSATSTCTAQAQCPRAGKWLNANQMNITAVSSTGLESVCVDIERIEPRSLPIDSHQWLQVEFRKELTLGTDRNYSCVFVHTLDNRQLDTKALKVTNNRLKCPLPHSSLLDKLYAPLAPLRMHMADDGIFRVADADQLPVSRIALGVYIKHAEYKYGWSNGAPMFNVTVRNCGMHESCVSCVSDECSWCDGKCRSAEQSDGCIDESDKCAWFDPATNKLLIPFTAHRQQAPLTFALNNTNDHSTDLECVITMHDGVPLERPISIPFKQLNQTHSSCVLSDTFASLEPLLTNGQVQTNLRLFNGRHYIDSPSNGKLSLVFYKCEYKSTDCSSCLSVNRQLSCMWCSGSCQFMNPHSKLAALSACIGQSNTLLVNRTRTLNQCDKPQITGIGPAKVPFSGGSVLTISGVNLGSSYDDLLAVYLKCSRETSVQCDPIRSKYTSSKQIGCKLRPFSGPIANANTKCTLSVKLRTSVIISGSSTVESNTGLMSLVVTSGQHVSLVDPIIHTVSPDHVIQSANFVWLTVHGVDLDAGRHRQLHIVDMVDEFKQRVVKCEIKNVTSTSVRCRLSEKFSTLGKKSLRLVIDEYTTINAQLKVNSDPLVKSINKWASYYAGGAKFQLSGFNFDSVQSAYTFVSYRDVWYSEPVSAKRRVSNERMEFETPALSEAFFALARADPGPRYLLQVGFLMDGFNVTLNDQYVSYVPDLSPHSLRIQSIQMLKHDQLYTLSIRVDMEPALSKQYDADLLKSNFQIYAGCSVCRDGQWGSTRDYTCTLPPLMSRSRDNSKSRDTNKSQNPIGEQACEAKVYTSMLGELNTHGRLPMLHMFVGNTRFDIDDARLLATNQNIQLYTRSYQMNNVDNFVQTMRQLSEESVRADAVDRLLDEYDKFVSEAEAAPGLLSTKSLFILSAIITSIVIILVLLTLSLSSYVLRLKSKKPVYTLGRSKRGRLAFDLIEKQIDQLETSIRPKCSQLYQQLHTDYLNEINNDLIYSLNGLPVWNYKTYLYSFIFPHKLDMIYSPFNLIMSASSMSNSTTNTLLSTHTPLQKANMSVYATIKSSSMLRFDDEPNKQQQQQQQFASYGNLGEAMLLFDQLIRNKNFLLTLTRVCQSQRETFGAKEAHNLASLITLVLKDNLNYLYTVIKSLLGEHIRDSLSSKRQICGADSLVEPLLTNFIAMFMYDYQRDSQTALHLYRLVQSLNSYIKMAPCDQVKQLAVHSLNQDTLLVDTHIAPYQTLYVNVVLDASVLSAPANGKNLFLVALIDADTVHQAKEKIVQCVFKRANMALFNVASAPSPLDVELELCLVLIQQGAESNQTTLITLKETEDELVHSADSLANHAPKRLLTLSDYNIQNGSFINLNMKSTMAPNKDNHVYMSTMSMTNEYVVYAAAAKSPPPDTKYHLIKPNDPYTSSNTSSLNVKQKKKRKKYEKLLTVKSQDSSVTTDTLIKHQDTPASLLTRLLVNKATIQPFIDQFIESIFSNSASLPPIVANLFDFIDTEINKSALKSDEALKCARMCKINVYFVRYWLSVIKNPELIVDCDKSSLLDSSLGCIAQAFLDTCSSTDVHNLYETNSAINRLLFVREVPKYKQMMDEFLADLKSAPSTSEHEMHFYLSEFSKCKSFELQSQAMGATVASQTSHSAQPELNSVQALLQLYEYYEKYQHQVNAALGQQQCSVLLPVHHRLVQIKELMSMSTLANNTQTLSRSAAVFANPYQQIQANGVNCYAATSDLIVSYPSMNSSLQPVNTLPHLSRNQFQPIQHQHHPISQLNQQPYQHQQQFF